MGCGRAADRASRLWGSGAKVNSAKRKKKKSSANKVKREKKVQLDGILVD